MAEYFYDPLDYLTSTTRALEAYVTDLLHANAQIGDVVDVEMSFPDTRSWDKKTPLQRALVHFELDDDPEVRLGLGVPYTQDDNDDDTTVVSEPALHVLNFDVGVWTSPQAGGTTKRAQLRQALYAIFGPAGARQALTEATDGLVVSSYGGGQDVLDRVNDLPVYRTAGITLIVKVFSKHVSPEPVGLIVEADQLEKLSIEGIDGSLEEVRTVEDPW